MSKPREFWLREDPKDIQTYGGWFAEDTPGYDDDIHVIEKSSYDELKAKADKLAEALELFMSCKKIKGAHLKIGLQTAHKAGLEALKDFRGEK